MTGSRARPALVILHGHDDDASRARRLAAGLGSGFRAVRTPEAPRDATGVRSWFDTAARGVEPASLERSLDLLRREVALCGPGPVVLAGFSQGAAMALAAASLEGVEAVVGLCAFLPAAEETDLSMGAPVLMLSNRDDEVVPAFLAEDAGAAMADAGREVTVEVLPGGHEVTVDATRRARRWLSDRWPAQLRAGSTLWDRRSC